MSTRCRIGILSILLLIAAAGVPAIAQTWSETVAAYERGDYATAYRGFRYHAERGDPAAQYRLGVMYRNGLGVSRSYVEAVRWFRRSAEQGHADAQYSLGGMYFYGRGVPQDYGVAFEWYRRGAEQGNAYSQYGLGSMYYRGNGVRQDHAEAAQWFRRAAERGYTHAQWWLGIMYEEGTGVLQDYVQAHKWYNIASSGIQESTNRARLVYNRERVAARLSPSQLAHAQRLAREWRPHGDNDSDSSPTLPAHVRRPEPREHLRRTMSGSGFLVSVSGHVLTNAHVVRDCAEVRVPPASSVRAISHDDASDLALLHVPASGGMVATFRQGRGIRAGARVMILGYPLPGRVSSETIVTAGVVSALAGPGDDRRLIQITAPIQPGNSGGPVLDSAGNVVGVVLSSLDSLQIANETGNIPQNVNFAVAAGTVRAFLDSESIPYLTAPSDTPLASDQVAASGKEFTVLVECWNPSR